jgi:hypothetical protein
LFGFTTIFYLNLNLSNRSVGAANWITDHRCLSMRSRSKSFECRMCSRKFARKQTLKDHYRVHTKEKPFTCAHANCQRSFSQVWLLWLNSRTTLFFVTVTEVILEHCTVLSYLLVLESQEKSPQYSTVLSTPAPPRIDRAEAHSGGNFRHVFAWSRPKNVNFFALLHAKRNSKTVYRSNSSKTDKMCIFGLNWPFSRAQRARKKIAIESICMCIFREFLRCLQRLLVLWQKTVQNYD